MAQDNKFGTFGGVFTPSILTILGVIMYMRLPWVVGNAGLYLGVGVIVVAHVISVCTGLSISSIATDKKVGAGGPYYIVSRSLGLPIGGTLGLALFVGLAFSISLYVIGFSESFLAFWGIAVTPTNIRICGTTTIVLLTVLTFISTALAIKSQYLILAAIAASLVSIFMGTVPTAPAAAQLRPIQGGEPLAVLFGIFFPAVTGFTAGVNMSGDLRNPTKSLPRGTMAAIFTGLVVYVGLAVFFALRVPAKQLIEDPEILLKIAWSPQAVVAGVWGATLSSALGSILGAPRILQAVASDSILPKWFAKGHGPTNEPRNALLLSFAIGEAGILIAELDAIARIVSMVFLATYAFLNVSCAIESAVSPDFRPAFKIPNMVSIVGAVVSLLVMIQLDLLAMAGATALMAGLFLLLSRKQLTLDAGDAWEGVWSSLIRSGLYRITRGKQHGRNWRPNILLFRGDDELQRSKLRDVAGALISGNGLLTELELSDDEREAQNPDDGLVGMFTERIPKGDVYDTIADICRYRGFAGLHPNTVLLSWNSYRDDEDRYGEMLDQISQLDHNLILYDWDATAEHRESRIDVWWRPGAGNVLLSISLLRFITRSRNFRDAEVRFLLLSNDSSSNDHLRATMRSLLTEARLDATIRIINNTLRTTRYKDHVQSESANAYMTIVGMPNDADECGPAWQQDVEELTKALGHVLLVRGSSGFEQVLRLSRQATISFLPPVAEEGGGQLELPAVNLPDTPDLARTVSKLADRYQRMVSRFHKACVQRVYGQEIKLVRRIKKAVLKHFAQLEKGIAGANPKRQRNLLNRLQSSLLLECSKLLDEFADKALNEQRNTLEGRIEAFLKGGGVVDTDEHAHPLVVHRSRDDFRAKPGDPPHIRRFKRRRRWANLFAGDEVSYRVPAAQLKAYYFERCISDALESTLRQFVTDSHHLMVHLGKTLSSGRMSLALPSQVEIDRDDGAEPDVDALLSRHKTDLLAHLDELIDHNKERVGRHQWRLLATSRELVQAFADDVDRLDVASVAASHRRIDKKASRALHARVEALPGDWFANQQLVLQRAQLGLMLSTFQHRLASVVEREKQAIVLMIKSGALGECEKVLDALHEFVEKLAVGAEGSHKGLEVRPDFDRRFDAQQVLDTLIQSTADLAAELPQWANTLSDQSIQKLEEGSNDPVETVEVPVFRLAQFLVEAKFVGTVQAELEKIPRLEEQAIGVGRDVMRLVTFQLTELEEANEVAPETVAAQLAPVTENGIERIEAQITALKEALARVSETIDRQLQVVIDGTNTYDLTSTSADLDQHIRRHQGKRAMSGVRFVAERSAERVKDAMVQLLYRRSAGVLMARELKSTSPHEGKVVDHILALVEAHMPRQDILESLPFYYRQLFFGQATINETFWVGRERQLAQAKRAIATFGRGSSGAIVVTGERGAGKSSLLQRVTTELLGRRNIVRVFPTRSGSTSPNDFAIALCKAAGVPGTPAEVLAAIPDGSIVLVDDLELWWERDEDGLQVIDRVIELVEQQQERTLFLLGLSRQAFTFINRFRSLGDDALAVLECGPFPADQLKQIITLRHGSTGLEFSLDDKTESELTEWRLARLFTEHFDYSRGYVGAALHAWIAHVHKFNGSVLTIDTPHLDNWDVLDELRAEWVALLLQLILHKRLERPRLAHVSGLEGAELTHDIDTLIRMGLVHDSQQGVLEINPFVHHILLERFLRRGLLA